VAIHWRLCVRKCGGAASDLQPKAWLWLCVMRPNRKNSQTAQATQPQLAIDLQRRDSRPTAVSAEKVRGLVVIAALTGVSARVRKESKKINLGYCPPPTVYRSIKGKAANENFFVDRKIVYGDDVRAH
jgi:hypothetical protein